MRLVFCSICIFFFINSANGVDEKGQYSILGPGNRSCGAFIKDANERSTTWYVEMGWVTGYLTAVNRDSFKGSNIAEHTDFESLSLWIKTYCTQNPLSNLATATENLPAALLKHSN